MKRIDDFNRFFLSVAELGRGDSKKGERKEKGKGGVGRGGMGNRKGEKGMGETGRKEVLEGGGGGVMHVVGYH
jgi:hypothetical protein